MLIGFFGALFIGLVLGLIGGGGSILTVPIFVYLFDIDPIVATSYSLFVVGVTATVGTIRNTFKGKVDYKIGIIFSIPAMLAVYFTRKYFIPSLPDTIATIGSYTLSKNVAIMVFFAVLMMVAAFFMLKERKNKKEGALLSKYKIPLIVIEGMAVGVLTGVVGAGGGFLIIPALVLLANLEMKTAVGTSLMIISIKSLIGFTGDIQTTEIDWFFLSAFTSIAVAGIFAGIFLSNYIEGNKLKKVFGIFVMVMGCYILVNELF